MSAWTDTRTIMFYNKNMGTNTIFLRRHLLWQWHGLAETLMLRKLIRPCDRPWQAVGSHLNQQRSVAHLFVKPSLK